MDVVEFPAGSGKFEVHFNGGPIECLEDTDCPGAALCALNATWSNQPWSGWCMCNTLFGFKGASCNLLCSHGAAILSINILVILFASILSLYSLRLLCSLANKHRNYKLLNPVFVTLAFVCLGSLMFVVAAIVSSVITTGFPKNFAIIPDMYGVKKRRPTQSLEYATNVTAALALCLSVCSIVVLPLTWINVAQRSLKLKKSQTNMIMVYSIVFVFVVLVVQLGFYVLAADGNRRHASQWTVPAVAVWGIVFCGVILLNVFAFVKVTQMKWKTSSDENQSASLSSDVAAINRLMTRIQWTSMMLVVVCALTLAFLAFFVVRSTRSWTSDPRCQLDTYDLLYRLSTLLILLACAIATWFVSPSAIKLARSSRMRAQTALPPAPSSPMLGYSSHVRSLDGRKLLSSKTSEIGEGGSKSGQSRYSPHGRSPRILFDEDPANSLVEPQEVINIDDTSNTAVVDKVQQNKLNRATKSDASTPTDGGIENNASTQEPPGLAPQNNIHQSENNGTLALA